MIAQDLVDLKIKLAQKVEESLSWSSKQLYYSKPKKEIRKGKSAIVVSEVQNVFIALR